MSDSEHNQMHPVDLLYTLRAAREQLEEAKVAYNAREAEVNQLLADELQALRAAQANVATLDAALRSTALDLYDADPEGAAKLPGVKFVTKNSVMIDVEAAKEWAMKSGFLMMLKLDESAARKQASIADFAWATKSTSVEVRVATDLSAALADMDAAALAALNLPAPEVSDV